MVNTRFFERQKSLPLKDIATLAGATLWAGDGSLLIEHVAPLESAGPHDLSFVRNINYLPYLDHTRAGAVLVDEQYRDRVPQKTAVLAMKHPEKGLFKVLNVLYKEPPSLSGIHPSAVIHESAQVGLGCSVGPGVVIEEEAVIGERCVIGAGSVIGRRVTMGADCHIGPHVTLMYATLGHHVRLKPGARIGQSGFGFFLSEDDSQDRMTQPQLGGVTVGDYVEIGANTTVDRGSVRDTVIESYVRIDNLVQIAHNVHVGKGSVIVAQVGIAGSATLEEGVVLGGQVGVAGHLTLKRGARVAAQSGVMRNAEAGEVLSGSPAMPHRLHFKMLAMLKNLTQNRGK